MNLLPEVRDWLHIVRGHFCPFTYVVRKTRREVTREMQWLAKHQAEKELPGNVIETHEHKGDFVESQGVSTALTFILDSVLEAGL